MIDEIDHDDQLRTAVRSALGDIVATTPEPTAEPLGTMPISTSTRTRRMPVLIGAGALAAAASLALVVVVATHDNSQPDAPAAASSPPTNATFTTIPPATVTPELWPVRIRATVAPWHVIEDEITAGLAAVDGPARGVLRCTTWTATNGVVDCTGLTGEGYLPGTIYTLDDDGKHYVEVSTLFSDIGVRQYATDFSQGKDTGYDDQGLPVQDVMVGRWPGALIEAPSGVRRVTIEPAPGVLVAVETGSAYSREDLLALAADVQPGSRTDETSPIPLVIAQSAPDVDGMRVTALGGVRDGNVCLLTEAGCAPLLGDEPLLGQHSVIGAAGFVGLASAEVASLGITSADGTNREVALEPAVVGTVKAFAVVLAPGDSVLPLDASGSPIAMGGDTVITVPAYVEGGTATATTIEIIDTTTVHS